MVPTHSRDKMDGVFVLAFIYRPLEVVSHISSWVVLEEVVQDVGGILVCMYY